MIAEGQQGWTSQGHQDCSVPPLENNSRRSVTPLRNYLISQNFPLIAHEIICLKEYLRDLKDVIRNEGIKSKMMLP